MLLIIGLFQRFSSGNFPKCSSIFQNSFDKVLFSHCFIYGSIGELNDEQNRYRNLKKDVEKQIRELQRSSESYLKASHDKDHMIDDLKSRKSALENEVDQLRRDLNYNKDEYKRVCQ